MRYIADDVFTLWLASSFAAVCLDLLSLKCSTTLHKGQLPSAPPAGDDEEGEQEERMDVLKVCLLISAIGECLSIRCLKVGSGSWYLVVQSCGMGEVTEK